MSRLDRDGLFDAWFFAAPTSSALLALATCAHTAVFVLHDQPSFDMSIACRRSCPLLLPQNPTELSTAIAAKSVVTEVAQGCHADPYTLGDCAPGSGSSYDAPISVSEGNADFIGCSQHSRTHLITNGLRYRHLASVQPLREEHAAANGGDGGVLVSAIAADTAARLLAARFASSAACGAAELAGEVADAGTDGVAVGDVGLGSGGHFAHRDL